LGFIRNLYRGGTVGEYALTTVFHYGLCPNVNSYSDLSDHIGLTSIGILDEDHIGLSPLKSIKEHGIVLHKIGIVGRVYTGEVGCRAPSYVQTQGPVPIPHTDFRGGGGHSGHQLHGLGYFHSPGDGTSQIVLDDDIIGPWGQVVEGLSVRV